MSSAGNPTGGTGCGSGLLFGGRSSYSCGDVPNSAYLHPQDVITFALPTRTVFDIGIDVLWAACVAASSEFNGYARKRYRLPLQGWGQGIVSKLAYRAAYTALRQRGFNADQNPQIVAGYEEAGQWMQDVRDYKIDPDVIESQPSVNTPRVSSSPRRGW